MEKELIELIENNGVVLNNKEEVERSLRDSLADNRFRFIEDNGKRIGFFTWVNKATGVFINNLLIYKGYRGFNLLRLRKFFPNVKLFYWKNRKKQVYIQRRNLCLH